jgi:hypothetical protein
MSISVSTLVTRCKQRADMEHSTFISDSEILTYINSSYQELYDILVSSFQDYYVSNASLIITSGNTFALPSDFYKMLGLDYDIGGTYYQLRRYNFNERNQNTNYRTGKQYRIQGNNVNIEPSGEAIGTYKLYYIPAANILTSASSTIDNCNGWEEYIVLDTAIKMKEKEESDVGALMGAKQAMLKRIENMSKERDTDTATITDIYTTNYEY